MDGNERLRQATHTALHGHGVLTRDEALLLYVAELRDRDGDELLDFLQRVDPLWDRYEYDDDLDVFFPRPKGQDDGNDN